ncbi:MAG: DNA-3-methyladenine glycosylase 2 family protein [Gemmataceae bacterium]
MSESLTRMYTRARRHLARTDPVLREVIARVGRCTLAPGGEPFPILVRSIIAQLISTRAAATITARVETAAGGALAPAPLLALGEAGLRPLGLSAAKAAAILDLALRATDGRIPCDQFAELTDSAIQDCLTAVKGIGTWTAEMFLIFGLGRTDVLPVADFGLRDGVRQSYALEKLPAARQLRELAEPWRPYRSIATWYIWRSRGLVPQS